jgi:hypothetical protein
LGRITYTPEAEQQINDLDDWVTKWDEDRAAQAGWRTTSPERRRGQPLG